MRGASSNSVRVRRLDVQDALDRLRRIAGEASRACPGIERVILFGSLARGDALPGSDADLLVVVDQDDRRPIDRIPEFLALFSGAGLPLDIVPVTRDELESEIRTGNRFLARALSEGIALLE